MSRKRKKSRRRPATAGFPVGDRVRVKGKRNRQLVDDYCYGFWNYR